MFLDDLGIKTLYDVTFSFPFENSVNGEKYAANEPFLCFAKADLADLSENKNFRSASSDGNGNLLFWENTNSVRFSLVNGVISKTGMAMLSNSKLVVKKPVDPKIISFTEKVEVGEKTTVELKHVPFSADTLFVRELISGEKKTVKLNENGTVTFPNAYTDYLVHYFFNYELGHQQLIIGDRAIDGFISMSGKFDYRNKENGETYTGIIEIPRAMMMNALSIHFGDHETGGVYRFVIDGYKVSASTGDRHDDYVAKVDFLNSRIISDI